MRSGEACNGSLMTFQSYRRDRLERQSSAERSLAGAAGSGTVREGAESRPSSGAPEFVGKGGVAVGAATCLEGVEPHVEVVDAESL